MGFGLQNRTAGVSSGDIAEKLKVVCSGVTLSYPVDTFLSCC